MSQTENVYYIMLFGNRIKETKIFGGTARHKQSHSLRDCFAFLYGFFVEQSALSVPTLYLFPP